MAGFFHFRKTRQPQAGAEAYAFYPATKLPNFTLFTGPGVAYMSGAIMATQPPQVYYPAPLLTTVGLGGLIYSTQYFQNLYQRRTIQ